MLAHDLAAIYGVTTFNLNKAVVRNRERFPEDFMFQITREEAEPLKFQIGISKQTGRGGRRRALAYAFAEQGVAMLSGILRSPRAVQANIHIMRAFVQLRRQALGHAELSRSLELVERQVTAQGRKLGEHEEKIKAIFVALRQLLAPPEKPGRPIGFRKEE